MSDYFDSLIARSLGSAGAVQPRLISRLEAALDANSPPLAGAVGEGFAVEQSADPSSHPTLTSTSAVERSVQPPTHTPLSPTNAAERSVEQSTQSPSLAPAAAERSVERPAAQRIVQPPSLAPQTPTHTAERSVERSVAERLVQPLRSQGSATPMLVKRPTASSLSVASPTAQPTTTVSFQPTLVRDMYNNVIGELRPVTSPIPSTPVADVPAPTVRVTIGRVEVRASLPPPPLPRRNPPPTAAPQRTGTSLEDYLKQRGEGRR